MSSVIANVVEIEAVHPHPNADRLFLARIKGWQAVIRKREDGSPHRLGRGHAPRRLARAPAQAPGA